QGPVTPPVGAGDFAVEARSRSGSAAVAVRGGGGGWAVVRGGAGEPTAEGLGDLAGAVAAIDVEAGDALLLAEWADRVGEVVADKLLEDQDEVHAAVADPLGQRVQQRWAGRLVGDPLQLVE